VTTFESPKELMARAISLENTQLTEDRDRLTLVIKAYWEHFDEDPIGLDIASCSQLEKFGVEPYVRKTRVGTTPKVLSGGDIQPEDIGYVIIVNLEGQKFRYNPKKSELEEVSKRVVVFGGFKVRPFGMPFMGEIENQESLKIYCKYQEALIQTYIFPR